MYGILVISKYGNLSMAVFLFLSIEATLVESSSSSLFELFDPGRCSVEFVYSEPV